MNDDPTVGSVLGDAVTRWMLIGPDRMGSEVHPTNAARILVLMESVPEVWEGWKLVEISSPPQWPAGSRN